MTTEAANPNPKTKAPSATILAVGTELVHGQIANTNAAWISERLTDLGIEVALHLAVPDDQEAIRSAMDRTTTDLVLITGGLGPTTDDFTREALSAWSGTPLTFREASWTKIQKRFESFGMPVPESNRQQCFFPSEATLFANEAGTADGFHFQAILPNRAHPLELIVLPGPPTEGKHLWEKSVGEWLRSWIATRFPALRRETIESWKCLGIGESALGEIVEAAVQGYGLKTGYRATVPYVEVKLWFPSGYAAPKRLEALARVNSELAPYSVARNEEDLGTRFLDTVRDCLPEDRITILDVGTSGALTQRMLALLSTEKDLRERFELLTRYAEHATPDELPESTEFIGHNEWIFALFPDGKTALLGPRGKVVKELPNPYASPAMADRRQRYWVEIALKSWTETLRSFASRSDEE